VSENSDAVDCRPARRRGILGLKEPFIMPILSSIESRYRSLVSRRSLLSLGALFFTPSLTHAADDRGQAHAAASSASVGPFYPTQDPALVKEMVTVAHGNVARVKELVGRQQTLAKASYDWGFGDWENALGAASHVGNREIAEFLLANGARPTIFSAAMLGQLDVVKAFVAAAPGVQKIKGPHSITLLRHATAGGAQAKPVLEYLTQLGGADDRLPDKPITTEEKTRLTGSYVFGAAASERFDVAIVREALQVGRTGGVPRGLTHLGGFEFCPAGAENVRIRFSESAGSVTLTVHDPDVVLTAKKSA
jgi:hypothetical protein